MKKVIYILSLLFAVSTTVNAQFVQNNNLSKAEFYIQKAEFDSAQKYIDIAITQEDFANHAEVWFYRSFIFKEQYKTKEKQDLNSTLRNECTISILKLYLVDTSNTYLEQAEPLVKYISSTYYNDAARAINNENYELANQNFSQYKQLQTLINADNNTLKEYEIQFKFAIATAISKGQDKVDSTQRHQLVSIYKEILTVDQNNPSANYNLSLLYYNEGVDIVNNMDYDMEFEGLMETQEKIATLFNEALPFMLKAYKQDYRKEDTLEGLKNIYYGLNDTEKSDYYKQELESLQK